MLAVPTSTTIGSASLAGESPCRRAQAADGAERRGQVEGTPLDEAARIGRENTPVGCERDVPGRLRGGDLADHDRAGLVIDVDVAVRRGRIQCTRDRV